MTSRKSKNLLGGALLPLIDFNRRIVDDDVSANKGHSIRDISTGIVNSCSIGQLSRHVKAPVVSDRKRGRSSRSGCDVMKSEALTTDPDADVSKFLR